MPANAGFARSSSVGMAMQSVATQTGPDAGFLAPPADDPVDKLSKIEAGIDLAGVRAADDVKHRALQSCAATPQPAAPERAPRRASRGSGCAEHRPGPRRGARDA